MTVGAHRAPTVGLLDHVLSLLREMDLRYQQRFDAQSEAIRNATVATERRFESVNEFRAALNDRAQQQVSTDRFESVIAGLNLRIQELAARVDKTEGRTSGVAAGWGYLVGAVGVGGAVLAILTR